MYGFTCHFEWEDRFYNCQVTYIGTDESDPESYDRVTADWDSEDPAALAQYELIHRDWDDQGYHTEVRICVWDMWAHWRPSDPNCDPSWSPPMPTEQQVLQVLASGGGEVLEYGWDT